MSIFISWIQPWKMDLMDGLMLSPHVPGEQLILPLSKTSTEGMGEGNWHSDFSVRSFACPEAVFGGDCDAWCSINVTKSSIMVISAPWWCNGDGDQHGFCKRIHEELQHWEKHSKFPNYWNTKRLMSSLGKRGLQRNLQQMLQHTQKITAFKSAPLRK